MGLWEKLTRKYCVFCTHYCGSVKGRKKCHFYVKIKEANPIAPKGYETMEQQWYDPLEKNKDLHCKDYRRPSGGIG
jgi:hypothetical protein